ncbi:MAG TPA: porin family protein [Saprospiraceae bacterium]|nr:porin family protein [Saprospiraceae bacterium]HPI07947.1 porin family protein [Saprospiraceae bacterium]
MKNIFLAALLLLTGQIAQSQSFFGIGIKGGLNTQVNRPDDIIINDGSGTTNFGVEKFKFGTQFGAYVRIGNAISIQPEVLFNSNKTDYKIGESSAGEVIKNEKYNYLDIPVLLGLKLGPIRAQAGPVGHYFLSSTSELTDINGYEARFKQFTWGWQAGLTLGTGRFSADIRYEGNFNNSGDHITFFGDEYHFDNTPGRLILGLNIALIK